METQPISSIQCECCAKNYPRKQTLWMPWEESYIKKVKVGPPPKEDPFIKVCVNCFTQLTKILAFDLNQVQLR